VGGRRRGVRGGGERGWRDDGKAVPMMGVLLDKKKKKNYETAQPNIKRKRN
jgi:hypothetical protein